MLSRSYSRKIWRTALLPIVDFISVLLGSGLIYLIRYRWLDDNFFGYNFGIKQIYGQVYLEWSIILALIVIFIYAILGLYEVNRRQNFWRSVFNLTFGVFVVLLGLITYFFFYEYNTDIFAQGIPVSRFILGTGGFLVLYVVFFGRALFWAVENLLFKFGWGKVDVVVIGDKHNYLFDFLRQRQDIENIFTYNSLTEQSLSDIEDSIKNGLVSEIYLFAGDSELELKLAILAERQKVSFIFSPIGLKDYDAYDLKAINIGQKVFLEMRYTKLDGWQVVLKRLFDILFASVFLILFSWLYLIIIIAIKLDSDGPIFYGNKRVGSNGKEFILWKFRRMKKEFCITDTNTQALELEKKLIEKNDIRGDILYKIKDDPRTTKVGRFLEKYSLDELPQFFNVLMGSLSLVGPRPHQLREVSKYSSHHYKVLNIKPGLTGMAQINGRSDLSLDDEVAFDTFYVENWNFLLDLKIIFKTPFIVLFKRHKA
jgi:exopolysaccharide biosynthesis polyprenyl glycosylphosphotransferase